MTSLLAEALAMIEYDDFEAYLLAVHSDHEPNIKRLLNVPSCFVFAETSYIVLCKQP